VDWLPRAESAAQAFGHESAVVAAVGMIYAERQLWGKARRLLEQAAGPGLPAARAAPPGANWPPWPQERRVAARAGMRPLPLR
jgi:hypothetical protein